ncbi:zinc ribbon domain-containing protein, partial [[Eubacterium] cellulosolvens]
MKCPECGALAAEDDVVCQSCGKPLAVPSENIQGPKTYNCDECNEELEYITTYKQWYCYNCQKYLDHPAPTSEPSPSAPVQKTTAKVSPDAEAIEKDTDADEELAAEPIIEPPSSIGWDDDAVVELEEDEEGEGADQEVEDEDDAEVEWGDENTVADEDEAEPETETGGPIEPSTSEIEIYEATAEAAEIGWDEALESADAGSPEVIDDADVISLDSPDVEDYDPAVDEVTFEKDFVSEPASTAELTTAPVSPPESEAAAAELPTDDDLETEFELDESELEPSPAKPGTERDQVTGGTDLKRKSIAKLHEAWVRI